MKAVTKRGGMGGWRAESIIEAFPHHFRNGHLCLAQPGDGEKICALIADDKSCADGPTRL